MRTAARTVLTLAAAGLFATTAVGTASAQSVDPVWGQLLTGSVGSVAAPFTPSPVVPWPEMATTENPFGASERTGFLTPDQPAFWNPLVEADRLVSPYGTSTRVVCTSFHGVTTGCWQADRQGNAHELRRLAANLPNVTGSLKPGGGAGTFVLPLGS